MKARKPAPLGEQSHVRDVGAGTVSYLTPKTATPDPKVIDMAAALTGLANQIKQKQA